MKEKINIAELLKDCPKGMELDCTCADNVVFDKIIEYEQIKCVIGECRDPLILDKYGRLLHICCPKCVIFPKGKTTWEGFTPPKPKFKCGDVVACDCSNGDSQLFIFKEYADNKRTVCYLFLDTDGTLDIDEFVYEIDRLATEEEKQKLFDAIKDNGYKWNAVTKTLEKLPKFKVGDGIVKRNSISNSWIVSSVSSEYYSLKLPNGSDGIGVLSISEQDDWELVPNKLDISTLKPFEKVLVRNTNKSIWHGQFYMAYDENEEYPFECTYNCWRYCIPYEGNEHLRGTTDECDEYYKIWKE